MANSRPIFALIVGAASLTILTSTASAGVAMSPLKQEVSLKPGDQTKLVVTIANNSRSENTPTETVHVEIADVEVQENGTLLLRSPGTKANSASKWISLDVQDIELKPGKSLPLEFTLTVPQFAQPGEYYTALLVTLNRKGRNENGVEVQYRIASGVFVTVEGRTLNRQAKISRCELLWPDPAPPATQPSKQATTQPLEPPAPKIAVVLQNIGDGRFDGTGNMVILDTKLRPSFRAQLISKRPCVFASDSRLFEALITKPLPAGKYLINVEMDYQSSWAKAHAQLPIEITDEQAGLMLQNAKLKHDDSPFLEANVEKVSPTIYNGGTRSIAITINNTTDAILHCSSSLVAADPETDAWMSTQTVLEPREFTLYKRGRRSIELRIHIPDGIKAGIYSSSIVIDSSVDSTDARKLIVPLEVEVRSQK
jgi:hypothetical protein